MLSLPVDHHPLTNSLSGLRFLLLGTCAVDPLVETANEMSIVVDHLPWAAHRDSHVPTSGGDYNATVISLTLRVILDEAASFLTHRSGDDLYWLRLLASGKADEILSICQNLIEEKVNKLRPLIEARPALFLSFLEPRSNYIGNLFPRYSLSNPAQFVRKLNEHLAESVSAFDTAYFIDINETLNLVGRMSVQDDYIAHLAHASFITDFNLHLDRNRQQRFTPPSRIYGSREGLKVFGTTLWRLIADNIAIIRRSDVIKLIIVDLDDTLWRGVAPDEEKPLFEFTEGWPLGLAEALLIFKARGGLLAICSRNDYKETAKKFDDIYRGRLSFDDFASIKINDQRKSINVSEILKKVNVSPENTLFIDDDARQVDEVRASHPSIRCLTGEHFNWRRIILLSPATQVPSLTKESMVRTALVHGAIERQQSRGNIEVTDWLQSLELGQKYVLLHATTDRAFGRAFELLNKTNQFNTTGRRWTHREVESLFAQGGYFLCSYLRDRIVDNGLIGVTVILKNTIVQAVLSCRVFGLYSENATGRVAASLILAGHDCVTATIVDTGRNFSCHNYFSDLGFNEQGENKTFALMTLPQHPRFIRHDFDEVGKLEVIKQMNAIYRESEQILNVRCRLSNLSDTVWAEDRDPIEVAYYLERAGKRVEAECHLTRLSTVLAPAQTVDLEVSVVLPKQPGRYTAHFVLNHGDAARGNGHKQITASCEIML